ncbi:lantibiotic dehydratase [Streptomyces profundus]|uniref:lantibiotic dehydratase n=1 Tax=Streptomyces profundus TaxID=2867410 RepID=UPI001D16CAD2|nr:lantibiotic dehydratase [Streptomyces sp. MA3_2.13]UED87396.1 lantibiotic dehydratase family protein [Streptomyces sp. MA3_2.13]
MQGTPTTDGGQFAAERAESELGPRFVLRVAGLPVDAVRALRSPAARDWADEVLAERERLRAAAESLGDLLHDLVAGRDDEAVRRALLKLRREVFNLRLPRNPDAALALVASVDPEAAPPLARWLSERATLAEAEAAGDALLTAELTRTRAALRELLAEERLRDGVLLASPALDGQLDAFAGTPPNRADKRGRKIERSLLAYLYRTARKTSPFSTFTGVALGRLAEEGQGPGAAAVAGDWRGHPRLNVLAVGRIADAVVADPARRADLPVAPAPGWGLDEDRVRYVRRWVTAGDDDTAVTFDTVKDRLFFLRRSGVLDRMLALFDRAEQVRYGEVAAWLAKDLDAAPDEVERYLAALLDVGMVRVPCLSLQAHDTDPLVAFQRSLRTLERPWAVRVANALDGPADCLRRFPAADPAGRRALLAELRGQLADIQRELGIAEPRVPRTVLYEDTVAPEVTAGRDAWTEALAEPLRSVERVLPAFDLTLPQRLTFRGFFLARYGAGGRCDDLLKLIHDFHEDFFDQYLSFTSRRTAFNAKGDYVPEENWLGLPQLRAVDAARRTFVDGVRARWAARQEAGTDGELVLDDGLFDATEAELGALPREPAHHSHHVQLAGEEPLVVLNRSYGGLHFPFSRFTHCFDDGDARGALSVELREHARRLQPPGAVFAEVTGGPVTSNLNLHGRLTDYEIVCPGETSSVPADRQLRLEDLSIVHDKDTDRLSLRSARLGCEVIPVYLGYLVPLALPEVPRTLLLLSPTSMAPLDVWGGVPEAEPERGVTRRPRVRYGRLVLARRSWRAPAEVLPPRAAGSGDAAWFLSWQRWRREHGLPARVFATVKDSAARGATGAKPQFVDVDSPLSLLAFEGLLRSNEAVVTFREALPDEEGPHLRTERGAHVMELAVETATSAHHHTRPEGDSW